MRIASRWVLVSAVALCVAGIASAQNPGGGRRGGGGAGQPGRGGFGGGMMGGGAMLLGSEGVQKELKLTDEQKTKVKEFTDAQREKMRDAFAGGQPDPEKFAEFRKTATEAAEKLVKDTLNADQQKRFKQLQYQAMGVRAFSNEDVTKALKLTDDQKEKIKGLSEEMQKDMQDLREDLRGGGDAATEARKKMQALNKDDLAKAADTLTSDQKKEWKELTGDPADPAIFQQGMGRGGRGGAGGGGGRRPGGNNPPPPPV